ncbi:CubicO group peptidase (beta-lactamase class C family) [Stella humosa]|uniref:CubicO group peptidase (Beta-lactamase class C family) n=1 Tax=Stella humosa TaxID=94 RepID=A0A3N1KRF5_9PROT|nr:serine hydrolase [Stella humosa]ROP84463.1 CubicO group peptidase (beta-lactamase class C family) [Stella humosa]BBK33982.1 serine hydrolase [Stella humosa]
MDTRSTPAIYSGPAVSRLHYAANTSLVDTGNIHLVSGLPLPEAIRSTNRIGDLDPALGHEVQRDWQRIYAFDAGRGTLTQTIGGYRRTLRHYGGLGCILLPAGFDDVFFDTTPYRAPKPAHASSDFDIDTGAMADDALAAAVDLAFAPDSMTASLLVIQGGRIIAERYGAGADADTMLASWSMGKSIAALVIGRLVQEGRLDIMAEAPIDEWRTVPEDSRHRIRPADLMRMSSGLRFSGAREAPHLWGRGVADHQLVYAEAIDSYAFSLAQPVQHPPETIGRYRNCDIAALGAIAARAERAAGRDPLTLVERLLLAPLGIRRMTLSADAYGNIIYTGMNYGTARDWARLGQLCLARGEWAGQRLVPAEFVDFMATPAPAWLSLPEPLSDFHHLYGGGCWLNRPTQRVASPWALPADAYNFAGAGGQRVFVVPSMDMVIVRHGHMRGVEPDQRTNDFLKALMRVLG